MNKFKSLLEKKVFSDNDVYKIVGAELKHRRLVMSKTLASVASNTCSISYASKVENSLIVPNEVFLSQICKKLKLSERDISNLHSLKNYLHRAISDFYFGNFEDLERIYQEIHVFDNYRSEIIKMIYFISLKREKIVRDIIVKIEKLFDTLSNFDIVVFGVFSGIFYHDQEMHTRALENLYLILKCQQKEGHLNALCLEYLCKSAYAINSSRLLSLIQKGIEETLIFGNINKILMFNEIAFCYSLKNESIDKNECFLEKVIMAKKYPAYCELLNLKKGKEVDLEKVKKADIYFYLLCAFHVDVELFKAEIVRVDDSQFTVKQNIVLSYWKLEAFKENSEKYLSDVAFPYSISVKDAFLLEYFGNLLIEKKCQKSQYKKALDYSLEIRKVHMEVNNF